MAKKKKEDKAVFFEISKGNHRGRYEVVVPKMYIPKIGVVNAADLESVPDVLEELVRINSGVVQKVGDVKKSNDANLKKE